MIGLFNDKHKITQHLNNFVENKNVMQSEIEELKYKTNKINELENIQSQSNNLESKINVLFNGKVEVIESEVIESVKKSSGKIPKLEITRKK